MSPADIIRGRLRLRGMAGPPLLPELGETDSEGEIAALYADIRATLGIPFVGLIYRTLAVEPGRLARVWSRLRPYLGHPQTWSAAAELDLGLEAAPAIAPVTGLAEAGFDTRLAAQATATLAAYDQMNRLNLLGLAVLLSPDRRTSTAASAAGRHPVDAFRWTREDLLPMADVDLLPAEERDLLVRISASLLPSRGPILIPSLLRHFARPRVLSLLWPSIRPAIEGGFVSAVAASLRRQAFALPLPAGVRIERMVEPGVVETCERFVWATSTMVVTGAMLERALQPRSAA